jgi:hypothetical protein
MFELEGRRRGEEMVREMIDSAVRETGAIVFLPDLT